MVLYGHVVDRGKIPEYFTSDILEMIDWWLKYRRYGWPYAGGWAEQPVVMLDVISTLDAEWDKRKK